MRIVRYRSYRTTRSAASNDTRASPPGPRPLGPFAVRAGSARPLQRPVLTREAGDVGVRAEIGTGGEEGEMRVEPHLWGVVLSGGEGVRLKALARRICGDERPKQYVPVFGDRTLLRQTLDRVALRIRPSRTAVVTLRSHSRFFVEHWAGPEPPRVLTQPTDRGTAAGILFPIHWVARQDPDAIVAVFPSDHFVSEPATFMALVARIAAWVHEHPARLMLLGAHPTSPEVDYGWIELRELGGTPPVVPTLCRRRGA